MSKDIYIAIEILSRELHGKVLLACIAAEHGYSAVIGNSTEMRDALRTWKPGIIVWKGLVKKVQKNYQLFHDFGHTVVAQCEEGLVYPSADFYTKLRVSREALDEVDLFFAWGRNQASDILKKVPGKEGKIILAGNPRIDLLDKRFRGVFEKDVEEIRKQHSPYLLVNTNFSSFTHTIGSEAVIQRLKAKGTIKTAEEEAFYRGRAENRKVLFDKFVVMLESLDSSLTGYNIILRPHPSEDVSLWQDAVSHLQSVKVIREGSAIPWIIGSELMIHNDCTTAIEATILGKDVISYRPTANNPYESELAVSFGVSAESIDELYDEIDRIFNNNKNMESAVNSAGIENLKHYISSIDSKLACETIAENLGQLPSNRVQKKSSFLSQLKMILRRQRYKIINYRKSHHKSSLISKETVGKNKNHLALSDVNEIIEKLNAHSGYFNDLDVKPVRGTRSCFRISKRY